MTIKEIFEAFDNIGFLTFATIDGNYPATRIAHFFAYDEDGLYFRTMSTKPFFHQLNETKTLSVCGLYEGAEYEDEENSNFSYNYSIRVTGDVKTISPDALRNKAKKNDIFQDSVEEMEKLKTMRTFVLYKGFGEIFQYDFEKEFSNDKLIRKYFSFNGMENPLRGLHINPEKCNLCGQCNKVCTFDAIKKGAKGYEILNHKCDACGECTNACKSNAIDVTAK